MRLNSILAAACMLLSASITASPADAQSRRDEYRRHAVRKQIAHEERRDAARHGTRRHVARRIRREEGRRDVKRAKVRNHIRVNCRVVSGRAERITVCR